MTSPERGDSSFPAIDPSLAAFNDFPHPLPPAASTALPPPPSCSPFSSFASTSASSTHPWPYDLAESAPHPSYPPLGAHSLADSSSLANDAFALPIPPPLPFGTAPFSTSSGPPSGSNTAKGKGKAVDRRMNDPAQADSTTSGVGRHGTKRARSASISGSSGVDYDEEEEEEEPEEAEGASPAPPSAGGKGGTSGQTRRRRDHRHGSFAKKVEKAGGLDKVAGRRLKYKGIGGTKGVVVPLLPVAFRKKRRSGQGQGGSVEEGDDVEDLEELLKRARDPAFTANLLNSIVKQQEQFTRAYQALVDELFKAQVEESVLNNVKQLVVNRRDRIRWEEKQKTQPAAAPTEK